eukprot:6047334-Alexandrium_andersonii.AAC.1
MLVLELNHVSFGRHYKCLAVRCVQGQREQKASSSNAVCYHIIKCETEDRSGKAQHSHARLGSRITAVEDLGSGVFRERQAAPSKAGAPPSLT